MIAKMMKQFELDKRAAEMKQMHEEVATIRGKLDHLSQKVESDSTALTNAEKTIKEISERISDFAKTIDEFENRWNFRNTKGACR